MRRLVVTRRSIRYLLSTAVILIGLSGWALGHYLWLQFKRHEETRRSAQFQGEVRTLRAKLTEEVGMLRAHVQGHRNKLLGLREQTMASQKLLANWKGVRDKFQASVSHQSKSSLAGQELVDELKTRLTSLQAELKDLIASVPSEWPAKGSVSSGFGQRPSPWTGKTEFHSGIDIANRHGTPIYAPGNGIVKFVGNEDGNGRSIVIDHGQGITTKYGHLSEIHVKKGDRVRKNQKIANVGNTGKSTNPHLHYELRVNNIPIDPRRLLLKQKPPLS